VKNVEIGSPIEMRLADIGGVNGGMVDSIRALTPPTTNLNTASPKLSGRRKVEI
jgi:hypothetical protein